MDLILSMVLNSKTWGKYLMENERTPANQMRSPTEQTSADAIREKQVTSKTSKERLPYAETQTFPIFNVVPVMVNETRNF